MGITVEKHSSTSASCVVTTWLLPSHSRARSEVHQWRGRGHYNFAVPGRLSQPAGPCRFRSSKLPKALTTTTSYKHIHSSQEGSELVRASCCKSFFTGGEKGMNGNEGREGSSTEDTTGKGSPFLHPLLVCSRSVCRNSFTCVTRCDAMVRAHS